jgi:hypothetical protein
LNNIEAEPGPQKHCDIGLIGSIVAIGQEVNDAKEPKLEGKGFEVS